MEKEAAIGAAFAHQRRDAAPENDLIALFQALGVLHKGPPCAQPFALVQCRPNFGVAPPALQLRGNDAGVIEHQAIPGVEERGQIPHDLIRKHIALHMEQAGAIPRGCGTQGNQLLRQIKVKKVNTHGVRLKFGRAVRQHRLWLRCSIRCGRR